MNIKYLFSALALLSASTFAASVAVTPAPYVITKSELSSPIILEGSQEHNYLKVSLTGTKKDTDKRVPINLALVIDRSRLYVR